MQNTAFSEEVCCKSAEHFLCFLKAFQWQLLTGIVLHLCYDLGNSNTARTWNGSWSTAASSCLRSHTYIYHKHWLLYRKTGDDRATTRNRNGFLVGLETPDAEWLVISPCYLQKLMFFDNSRYLHSLTHSSLLSKLLKMLHYVLQ